MNLMPVMGNVQLCHRFASQDWLFEKLFCVWQDAFQSLIYVPVPVIDITVLSFLVVLAILLVQFVSTQ